MNKFKELAVKKLVLTLTVMLAAALPAAAWAGDYYGESWNGGTYGGGYHSANSYHGTYGNYYHGGYSGGSYSNGGERRYHYSVGYRDGGAPFAYNFFRKGTDYRNGYTGSYAPDNHPHRADWEAYLRRINAQARKGTYEGDLGAIEPGAGPSSASRSLCGNWQRADGSCRVQGETRRWQPWMVVYDQ